MDHLWRDIMRVVNTLDVDEWVMLLAGLIVLGLFCLRGFGSRSQY